MACSSPNVMAVHRYSSGHNMTSFLGPYKVERTSEYWRRLYEYENYSTVIHSNLVLVGCRLCRHCRKLRALNMATRCYLEMKHFEEKFNLPSSFVTLTYDPDHLPKAGSLYYPHFQDFMKRYRRWLDHRGMGHIKFYMCGEYGRKLQRPHYHAIIFGHIPSDLQFHGSEHGHTVYRSDSLAGLWRKGYVTVGQASMASARYVASYIHKKDYGPRRDEHYGSRVPEFTQGSKRKGIGLFWLEEHWSDVMAYDDLTVGGETFPIPDYFTRKLSEMFPGSMSDVKRARFDRAMDKLDKTILAGESDLANRYRNGQFLELLHAQTFTRSFEDGA